MGIQVLLPAPQTTPLPAFDITPSIENVTYTLRFQWMQRDNGWRIEVLDNPGQVTIMGQVRLVTDWPLYASRTYRFPSGYFMLFDTSGGETDPTLAGLGDRWVLYYFPASELA